MLILEDIHSFSDFQRHARAHIDRLAKSGRPEVLTVNGKARLVVQDAMAYQKLLNELEEAKTAAAIHDAERGQGIPVKEAFALLRKRIAARKKQ